MAGRGAPEGALHAAAERGDVAAVRALVALDVAVLVPSAEACNVRDGLLGGTALHLACESGHLACVEALLELGATADTPDDAGTNSIHIAAERGHEEVLAALLRARAGANAANAEGETPLLWAAARGRLRHLRAAGGVLRSVRSVRREPRQ